MTLHKSPDSPLSWLNALTASKPTAGPILQFRQKSPPPTAYQRAPRPGSTNGKGRPAGAGGGKKRIGRNGCGWHIKVQGGTNLLWPIFNFPEWAFLGAQHLLWAKAFLSWGQRYFWWCVRPPFEIGLRATRVGLLCATISQFRGNLGQKWAPVHLITSTTPLWTSKQERRKRNRQMWGLHCKKATNFYLKTLLTAGCSCWWWFLGTRWWTRNTHRNDYFDQWKSDKTNPSFPFSWMSTEHCLVLFALFHGHQHHHRHCHHLIIFWFIIMITITIIIS